MKGWDRVAWLCSWVAPIGFSVAGVVFVLALWGANVAWPEQRLHGLEIGALVFACGGLVAHMVLVYHIHHRAGLSAQDSSRLAALLHFGIGYARWRDTRQPSQKQV